MNAHVPTVGRYRIESEIGRGSMGTVYLALDPVLERRVAIKTLNPNLSEDSILEFKTRFVREAKAAGRLNHPNIVTVYDAGVAGDVAYIAMEYLEGASLHQLLKSGAALPLDKVAEIVAQVADGLDYAGRFGIVHRDIKPANIMVSPTGVAKITDFGVVHVPSSSMTQTGMLLGSPKYTSPEQALDRPIDPRADIFSLGVVLYQMLAGKTPFERDDGDVMALLDRITKEPAAPLALLRPELPAELEAILAGALAKDPAQRFQRAGELAQRLRELVVPAARAPFAPDPAPAPESPAPQANLSRLLAELESTSRRASAALAAGELSLQLRKAFHYFEELVRQVIHASPPLAARLDLIYLGSLPAANLSNGTVECKTRKLDEAEVVDTVTLTYRMTAGTKARIALNRAEAALLKSRLAEAKLKFDSREVLDNTGVLGADFEAFLIDVDISARATLRGDYARKTVEIDCENVGVLGTARYSLPAAEFDEAVWEFGQLLFGLPSRFAGLRLPAGRA
jgi:serine/threonine protein kinase